MDKIGQLHSDMNKVHEDWDNGLIENDVAMKSLKNICQAFLAEKDLDIWLYPEDLQDENIVVNLFSDGDYQANFYTLPNNWKELVTNNGGKDGKPSIHDIMKGT